MRRWLKAVIVPLVVAVVAACASPIARADEGEVDVLLVLAADVSRSVDDKKFKLQREGYAAAIVDPRVVRAMTGGPKGRIAVFFVEWASRMGTAGRDRLDDHCRRAGCPAGVRPHAGSGPFLLGRTSISAAIDFSMQVLSRSPFPSGRRIIDISGDGTNNSGREVTSARDAAIAQGVTINGLVDPERGAAGH